MHQIYFWINIFLYFYKKLLINIFMKKLLLSLLLVTGFSSVGQTTCALATNITTNGTITSPSYAASTYSNGCLASKTGIRAIWYKYTPTTNGEITISSDLAANNGTTYTDDTRISVFTGTCSALTCVGDNDDVSDTNYLSSLTIPVAAGTTYYIQWDNYWYAGTATANLGFQFTFNYVAASCIRPSEFDFYLPDTYTTTSASLYWNQAIGSPANYDTDWSTNFAAAAGTGTIVSTSTLNAGPPAYATSTISGIPASSNVRYFVRSNCGATQSAWQGPFYAYLAKVLPYSNTFENAANNYTDGFIGFSRLTSSGTSTPPNYADGGAGNSMYTFNSTTAVSNLRAYSRAISLQAGEVVTFNFKTRLYPATGVPMTCNVTVGTDQSATAQSTILLSFTENSPAAYTQRTATYTAPSAGIYYFGFHNNSPAGTVQSYLFLDTLDFTSVLGTKEFSESKFSVFPNPTNGLVEISNTTDATISSVELCDLNGRVVKRISLVENQTQVNISEFSQGVYFMKIISDKGIVTKKIIKE